VRRLRRCTTRIRHPFGIGSVEMAANRRDFYRIPYPAEDRPRFVVGDSICEVLDCSERGLRYRPSIPETPALRDVVTGRLRFLRGEEIHLRGEVVRVKGGEVAVHLVDAGIPFGTILQEQFYLRRAAR
jgi:hypothetical protein